LSKKFLEIFKIEAFKFVAEISKFINENLKWWHPQNF